MDIGIIEPVSWWCSGTEHLMAWSSKLRIHSTKSNALRDRLHSWTVCND